MLHLCAIRREVEDSPSLLLYDHLLPASKLLDHDPSLCSETPG